MRRKMRSNLLRQASKIGSLKLVKILVEKECEYDKYDSALFWAARNDHLEVFRFLVGKGYTSCNPYHHIEIINYLKSKELK